DYQLIAVGKDEYPGGEGQHWADPSVEHAAELMRWACDNRAAGEQIGRAAADAIKALYAPNVVGAAIVSRLQEVHRALFPLDKSSAEMHTSWDRTASTRRSA